MVVILYLLQWFKAESSLTGLLLDKEYTKFGFPQTDYIRYSLTVYYLSFVLNVYQSGRFVFKVII